MPYISATAEIMYAPFDLRLVIISQLDSRDDSRADSRIRSLFFLIHDPVHAAESRQTLTARAHPNRGGLLWTKIMLSVYWKVSSKPAKMDKRGTRTPLRT